MEALYYLLVEQRDVQVYAQVELVIKFRVSLRLFVFEQIKAASRLMIYFLLRRIFQIPER